MAHKTKKAWGRAQDIEWAIHRDYVLPESIFILQTRPETIWSKREADSRLGISATSKSLISDLLLRIKG